MNKEAVACAILTQQTCEQNGTHEDGEHILSFTSSLCCREALKSEAPTTAVIVYNGRGDVSPINLAGALCSDEPERDVYFVEDVPTEALALRARVIGIRGIISSAQAQRLVSSSEKGLQAKVRSLPRVEGSRNVLPAEAPIDAPLDVSGEVPGEEPGEEPGEAPAGAPITATVESTAIVPLRPSAHSKGAQGAVIGLFSGRGGVGKSTVALMAALAAQRRKARVALVDLDFQFGDLGFLAGNEPSSRIERLPLTQLCGSQRVPTLSEEALTLALAPEQPEQGEQLAAGVLPVIEDLVAQRDVVIVNTGTFWSGIHAQMVRRCDHLVFLMDQRATSIEACRQAVDLCLRLQAPQARFVFALNGCGRHATLTPLDVSLALGGVEVIGLADGGTLVDELLALGCPKELLASGNAFVDSMEALLDHLAIGTSVFRKGSQAGSSEQSGAGIFDFAALRGFLKGGHRVAS